MKFKTRVTAVAVLAVLSAAVCTAAFVLPDAAPAEETEERETAAEYYLRDCEGYVAVYRGASVTPSDVTDIETATLNDTDVKLLRSGIPARSRNELLLLLEDLGS